MNKLILFLCCLSSFHGYSEFIPTYAEIVENSTFGIVNIRTHTALHRTEVSDLYQFFLGEKIPRNEPNTSLGSGIIFHKKGLIVTTARIIEGVEEVSVFFPRTKKLEIAKIMGIDKHSDIALLQVSIKKELRPLSLGDDSKAKVGDKVLALGNPFGYAPITTTGIISAKGNITGTGPYDHYMQTDASIQPGNSGGPLIDLRGRVIGINSYKNELGTGLGYIIPINLVKKIVNELEKHGKIIKPWMGIIGKNILNDDDMDSKKNEHTGLFGILVANLIVDGPAYKAGLKIGDIIMAINNQNIYDLNMLYQILLDCKPVEILQIKIYRRGEGALMVKLPLDSEPQAKDLPNQSDLF